MRDSCPSDRGRGKGRRGGVAWGAAEGLKDRGGLSREGRVQGGDEAAVQQRGGGGVLS
mgnify:CR=1 FL=1